MYRCARVQGLDTSEGLLLFGKEHFYVIDGYTMTVSREIRDIDTLPSKYVPTDCIERMETEGLHSRSPSPPGGCHT